MLLSSIVGMTFACQMSQMLPDFYTATLEIQSVKQVTLDLTNHFYGAKFNYPYTLKSNGAQFSGNNPKNGRVTLNQLSEKDGRLYFYLDLSRGGQIEMTCTEN